MAVHVNKLIASYFYFIYCNLLHRPLLNPSSVVAYSLRNGTTMWLNKMGLGSFCTQSIVCVFILVHSLITTQSEVFLWENVPKFGNFKKEVWKWAGVNILRHVYATVMNTQYTSYHDRPNCDHGRWHFYPMI